MSIFAMHGYNTKLHVFHLLIAFLCALTCFPVSESLKPFEYRPFPSISFIVVDYSRLHHVAPAVLTLQLINAATFCVVLLIDLYRRRTLPVAVEIALSILCIGLQVASTALISAARPTTQINAYRGGTTNGVIGSNGKLGILDAVATIQVEWNLTSVLAITVLAFLSLHVTWQLLVSIRHLRIRPRVFLEPIPGDYRWTLEPVSLHDRPAFTMAFSGVRSERAKEWIETGQRPPKY